MRGIVLKLRPTIGHDLFEPLEAAIDEFLKQLAFFRALLGRQRTREAAH
jgi:hypothetical protein